MRFGQHHDTHPQACVLELKKTIHSTERNNRGSRVLTTRRYRRTLVPSQLYPSYVPNAPGERLQGPHHRRWRNICGQARPP